MQRKAIKLRRNSIICVGLLNSSCILWHMLALDMPNWYQMPKAVINFYNICYCTKLGNCILDASFGRLCYMFQDKVTLCQIKSLFLLILSCNFQVSTAMQKLLTIIVYTPFPNQTLSKQIKNKLCFWYKHSERYKPHLRFNAIVRLLSLLVGNVFLE